jgi:homogentisate 1,2-dioxygenase
MTELSATGYMSGFVNEFATEALPGALPVGQNSPQVCPYGLYAEQISGTAFTAPRTQNRRTWAYRIRPGAQHGPFAKLDHPTWLADVGTGPVTPERLRWSPLPLPQAPVDFLGSILTMAASGSAAAGTGIAIHLYAANQGMHGVYAYNADAEMLLVPQEGRLLVQTELGTLEVAPQEVATIPRGIRFAIQLPDGQARGYLLENFGALLRIPDLGPIGSNGLCNPRDVLTPVAAYEDKTGDFRLIARFQGHLWQAPIGHSPLDVVAWHGNFAPWKYDLRRFNTIGSISYDHPDPSIFTVFTSPSDTPGTANLDFVIFPPRWLVAQNTFRPPWFHRNVAAEFMGLICGAYDAKVGGFVPGGASLHNTMSGHGPDAATFAKASAADLSKPDVLTQTMAFMFETRAVLRPADQALALPTLQQDYWQCWQGLPHQFDPTRP